ncbi:hypothetical protein CBR_g45418 [Chara braunii]|uniref:IMS import disulfide relay-system CHCH-CHCH-like Cx9C domain-containing protein n=1 Tax=Chara braunii TaxID=69332 RepID=A0A388LYG4_CHABU|nr:hypothetical protein CBR_g45418 [Chara braunii]|eukprot:GBG87358.1 hypothetical protein CBR_g45418 [Chara braunii]
MTKKVLEKLLRNPRLMSMQQKKNFPCFMEMMTYMSALKNYNFDDDKCAGARAELELCVETQAKQEKRRDTFNYHLQRIGRMMRT